MSGFSLDERPTGKAKMLQEKLLKWKVIYLNQSPTTVLELTYTLLDKLPFSCSFKQVPRWSLIAKTSSLRRLL